MIDTPPNSWNLTPIDETAEIQKMSIRNVHRWIDEGTCKAFKLGHQCRIPDEDLQAFIDEVRRR